MKLLFCLFTLLFTSTCFAEELHDYNAVKAAVLNGQLIRIVVDYNQCTILGPKGLVPNNAAAFTPNGIALMASDKIGAYILYFTMRDPWHPLQAVYQYGTYILSNDNTLTITFTVLNAADYKPFDEKGIVDCKMNEGAHIFINNNLPMAAN